MTTELHSPIPRALVERREDAQRMLAANSQLWLATGGPQGAHLIPVSYVWDAAVLTMSTFVRSRTAANLRANGRARVAIGETSDVVIVDGSVTFVDVPCMDQSMADRYARVSHDPRVMPGLVYLRLMPERILVWNGFHEYTGRTVMLNGTWLTEPVD